MRVLLSELMYAKASGSFTLVYLSAEARKRLRLTDPTLVQTMNLGHFEAQLPQFVRISRSVLVNLHHVDFVGKTALHLADGQTLSLPREGHRRLLERLQALKTR